MEVKVLEEEEEETGSQQEVPFDLDEWWCRVNGVIGLVMEPIKWHALPDGERQAQWIKDMWAGLCWITHAKSS